MKKTIFILILVIFIIYLGFNLNWSKLFSHGELSEAHQEIERSGDCKACHTKGQKLDNDKCLICHEEIKRKIEMNSGYHARVSKDCATCHSEHHGKSYGLIHLDIKTFDHNLTGWPLTGKHTLLKCDACHSREKYLLKKNKCIDCHFDVHLGQLGTECDKCHNEQKFKIPVYQHKDTEKSPKGKHINITCSYCHIMEFADYPSDKGLAVRYTGIDFSCSKCHQDPHDGEYGFDCSECHNQLTFEVE